jgi:hypothetical protein
MSKPITIGDLIEQLEDLAGDLGMHTLVFISDSERGDHPASKVEATTDPYYNMPVVVVR